MRNKSKAFQLGTASPFANLFHGDGRAKRVLLRVESTKKLHVVLCFFFMPDRGGPRNEKKGSEHNEDDSLI